MGTSWQTIHTRFPIVCEGEPGKCVGKYRGCAAWNENQGFCNTLITRGGECYRSLEQAAEIERQILKGEI